MAQGLVTAACLTGEAQKLAAAVIGRPSEEEVNQGANISCAQRQGGCWANWPHPRSCEEIFFLPRVLWVRRSPKCGILFDEGGCETTEQQDSGLRAQQIDQETSDM